MYVTYLHLYGWAVLMNLQRVASIEDEHRIFATFAKASIYPEKSNTVMSSLVVVEHFIHSYHFRFQNCEWEMDSAIFIILIIYSRYDNTSFLATGTTIDIFSAMEGHLRESYTSYPCIFHSTHWET